MVSQSAALNDRNQVYLNAFIYLQNMAKLTVGFPTWRHPNKFINVALWEQCTLTMRFLDVAKCTTPTALSLIILCKPSFPVVGLKISSQPSLTVKFPNKMFIWYLGNISNTCFNSSYRSCPPHHQFYLLLGHEHSEPYDAKKKKKLCGP
jgi:hypothetical protein